jgi:ABC-2 type transport system ATP-binding protein
MAPVVPVETVSRWQPRPLERSDEEVIVLAGLTKLYEPTPRWMRPFARTHIRHPVLALDGVDLLVHGGDVCVIVGPNGAGKTTLFRILMGLATATEGHGSVLGLDVDRDSEQIRQIVGWMSAEDSSLFLRATLKENLLLHGRLQGMPRRELVRRISEVLEAVGLVAQTDSMVASLSAGMKARLRLARALLPGPRALILDEPTSAVDPIAAHRLLTLITDLAKRERLAVLISSHRLEEIEVLQSQALLLDEGRVRYSGDLNALRSDWEAPQLEITFNDPEDAREAAVQLAELGIRVALDGAALRCGLKAKQSVGSVLAGLGRLATSIQRAREIPMPLRDLIARMYSRDASVEEGAL